MSKGYYVQADHLSVLAGKLVTEHAKGASTKTQCSKCHALPGPVIEQWEVSGKYAPPAT